MAILIASIVGSASGVDHNPHLSSQLDDLLRILPPYNLNISSNYLDAGVTTKRAIPSGVVVASKYIKTYADDFYERIHIIPSIVNVGSITSDISTNIEIWNAFREIAQTVTAINETDTTGVNFSMSTPSVFNPLESKIEILEIFISGPAELNAIYELIFSGAPSAFLRSTGERVLALPYIFGAPATEILRFNTDIMKSIDGTEQRTRLKTAPINIFKVRLPIPNGEMTRAFNLIYGWRVNNWALPIWTEARIGDSVNAGDTVLAVATLGLNIKVGGFICVWQNARLFQVITIVSFSSQIVTIASPITSAMTTPYYMPAVSSVMISDPKRKHNGNNGYIDAEFRLIDNEVIDAQSGDGGFVDTGDGIEANAINPLSPGKDITETIRNQFDIIDYKTGGIATFSNWKHSKVAKKIKYILETQNEIIRFRRFIYRRAGRQVPFYMPSGSNDFDLIRTSDITDSFIVSAGGGYANYAASRTIIAFSVGDEDYVYARIIGVIANGDGTETISLDRSVFISLDRRLDFISYVGLYRLDSDEISFKWHPSGVVEVVLSVLEIKA